MGKHNPDTSKWGNLTNEQLDAKMGELQDTWSKPFFGKSLTNDPVKNRELGTTFGGNTISDIADQIQVYKQANAVKSELAMEKRRVQEKQIRALRNSYRPAGGLMRSADVNQAGTLGDSTGLPNKLGTA